MFILLFSYQWMIALFTRELLRVTVYYYYVTYASEAVVTRCSVKKGVLRSFAKFTGKHFYQSLFFKKETLAQVFSCEFCEISKNTFPYRHLRWLLLEFQNESTLYRFRTSCSKQAQYLKFQ